MTLNQQQRENLVADADALNSALCSAWRTFYLMRGIHLGVKEHPQALERYPRALSEIWRAQFWALVANTGNLLDRTSNTHSLPRLLIKIRRYFKKCPKLEMLADEIESQLNADDGPFRKIREWRHKVIAHNSRDAIEVFDIYPMALDEIEALLNQLTELTGQAVWNSVAIHYYDHKTVTRGYEGNGKAVMKHLAA